MVYSDILFLPPFCILSFAIIISRNLYMKRKLAFLTCRISGLGTTYVERIAVMKKLFALILTICLLAAVFCVTALAAESEPTPSEAVTAEKVTAESDYLEYPGKEPLRFALATFGMAGSMVGSGSLIMVVSLTALLISVAALVIAITANKKIVTFKSENEK